MKKFDFPFKPIGNQLMLEEIETAEESEGGIVLPASVRKPVNQGRIVARGEDVPIDPSPDMSREGNAFDLGNIVVFPLYSDSAIETRVPDPKHADRTIAKRFTIVDYTQVICSDFGFFASLQT